MSKRKRKSQPKTWVETFQATRKDWGAVNPVTKIIPDKRRKPPKYKGSWE